MAYKWWNNSDGRAITALDKHLLASFQGFDSRCSQIIGIVWILIPACLTKQPSGHSAECGCKRT